MALHPGSPFTLFGIPNCDSVKRARAWFAAQAGVAPVFHDFKKAGLPEPELDAWVEAVGWERLLNRKGSTWLGLDDAARAAVVDASAAKRAMLAQPSLVKRPVVAWPDGSITVGFDASLFVQKRAQSA